MKKSITIYLLAVIFLLFLAFIYFFFNKKNNTTVKKDFNIVLITIDCLRADHLSCYGYERKTSPNIDNIAAQGIIFKNATSPSSWTVPSMVSLFTSLYPSNHGIVRGLGWGGKREVQKQDAISDKLTTLPEILKEKGYTTFGVASNIHLGERLGFARGFDYFKCLSYLPAPPVNQTIYAWEEEIKNAEKFFLWVHYIDPHDPYYPRKPWIDDYTKALPPELNPSEEYIEKFLKEILVLKKDPLQFETLAQLVKPPQRPLRGVPTLP